MSNKFTADFETAQVDHWDKTISNTFDFGGMPPEVQNRLNRTYAALKKVPQETISPKKHRIRKSAIAIISAAACMVFAGAAFAASNMLHMQQGDAPFFEGNRNLPIYNSLEPGAKALSANVDQTFILPSAEDSDMQVTLNSISCDKNVANVYFTLHKDGGFDLEAASNYEGSNESTWAKLQNILPSFQFTLSNEEGISSQGNMRNLDAYLEGEDIKCLYRAVPASTISDQVQLNLSAWTENGLRDIISVGLDMSDIPNPKELVSQQMIFATQQGEKKLEVERFTASELATVLVVSNVEEQWLDDSGRECSGIPQNAINPAFLEIKDNKGNILHCVSEDTASGQDNKEFRIIEFAGLDNEAQSLSFTPMLNSKGEDLRQDVKIEVDVSAPNQRIELTDFGGYDITSWKIDDQTVIIGMMPYGWVPTETAPSLITDTVVPMLGDTWIDPETGERGIGYHSAIEYIKSDYITGEAIQMDSYYKATKVELEAIHNYYTYGYQPGTFIEDTSATLVFALQ